MSKKKSAVFNEVYTEDGKLLGKAKLTPARRERYWNMSDEPDGKLAICDAWLVLTRTQMKAFGITRYTPIFIAP